MLKNIQGKTIGNIWKTLFYPKKYFKKIRTMPKNSTRRERLKSAPYLRLKKRKKKFWKKIEIFEKFFSFKKSRIVPKNVKRGSFWIYKHTFRCKISKNSKGGPFGDKKNFENVETVETKKNVAQCRKNSKGGPYSLVLFCILR